MVPAPAVEMLRGEHARAGHLDSASAAKSLSAMRIRNLAAELQVSFVPEANRPLSIELRSEDDEPFAAISYRPEDSGRELSINKTRAALATAPGQPIHLRLFVDGSVLELFANDRAVITERVYTAPRTPLKIVAQPGSPVSSVDLWAMRPISPDRLTS